MLNWKVYIEFICIMISNHWPTSLGNKLLWSGQSSAIPSDFIESINPSLLHHKRSQGDREHHVLASIAKSNTGRKDSHLLIKGVMDDLVRDEGNNDQFPDSELAAAYEKDPEVERGTSLDRVDFSSFIIQRLSEKNNATFYYAFQDTAQAKPLFRRSREDFGVDFIIFMDPNFPKGTGHYIVLRRLETQTDVLNYAADDEFARQENYEQRMQYDFDQNDDYDENQSQSGEDVEEYPDPRKGEPPGGHSFGFQPQGNENMPGENQSGEENSENIGEEKRDDGVLVSPYNETLFYGKVVGVGVITPNNDVDPYELNKHGENNTEVIYESFVVVFKGSIQGFINNVDPLQFSFQAEGDPSKVLNESEEDDLDKPNTEGEDDDDDESYYGEAIDEAPVDLFQESSFSDFDDNSKLGKGRKKRSAQERKKVVRLKNCLRRLDGEAVESWRKLEQWLIEDLA